MNATVREMMLAAERRREDLAAIKHLDFPISPELLNDERLGDN